MILFESRPSPDAATPGETRGGNELDFCPVAAVTLLEGFEVLAEEIALSDLLVVADANDSFVRVGVGAGACCVVAGVASTLGSSRTGCFGEGSGLEDSLRPTGVTFGERFVPATELAGMVGAMSVEFVVSSGLGFFPVKISGATAEG